ncbi:unnamed protein product [Chilo suppressalis]|uniref:protein-tyrosine-phosphatase n=1 Tax=Chilo suppressalis TaxID=168631 RepID=A0ABN8BA50_CHISP|nr:unnamed protein product [Chilo suppressalis]
MTMDHSTGKCSATFGLYFAFIALCYPVFAQDSLEIEVTAKGEIGNTASINCTVSPEPEDIKWIFQKETIIIDTNRTKLTKVDVKQKVNDPDGNVMMKKVLQVLISNVTDADSGNYTCRAKRGDKVVNKTVALDLSFPGRLVNKTLGPLRLNVSVPENKHGKLFCLFEVYKKPANIAWYKKEMIQLEQQDTKKVDPQLRSAIPVGLKQINGTFDLHVTAETNGTYVCEINDEVTGKNIQGEIDVFVYDKPKIVSFNALAINTTQIYMNWTVNTYNSPVESYSLFIRESPSENYNLYTLEKIAPRNTTSFVINGLNKSTEYQVKLEVKTQGWSDTGLWMDPNTVKTLDKEPVFVPKISINGFSATSVTIGWPPPPEDIADLIHYYHLEGRKNGENKTREAYHPRDGKNLPYMFPELDPHSTYVFRVRACSEYTREQCGPWSEKMEAATLDGIPGKPSNVHVNCDEGFMNITWEPPEKPNAEIKGYTMELTGNATYKDRYGTLKEDMWGPLSRFTTNDSRSARFDLQPNSKYTVRLSAMTRTRRRGEEETRYCETRPLSPDAPPRPRWRKILENNRYLFKMYLPRITERNGPICCYRVHMVRMLPNMDWKNLPPPRDIAVIDYGEAHAVQPTPGGYITDIFSNDKFPSDSELIMGDLNSIFDKEDTTIYSKACRRCLIRPRNNPPDYPIPNIPTTTEDDLFDDTTAAPVEPERARRSPEDYSNNPMMRNNTNEEDKLKDNELNVKDGQLDSLSNYTLFVELIPGQPHLEPMYSEYVIPLMPAPSPPAIVPSSAIEIALQVTCAVAAVVLLIMIVFCLLQARRSRKVPPHAPLEMNRIQAVFRYVVGHIGGRQMALSATPPDVPPIPRDQLAAAYAERQADCDYGFQKEFELLQMLPECFPDRTTHASEARENQPKNRYPDIKAYDQTRVKLSQIDSITGSDYINANYVSGYRDRKLFICAQGPTDTTVNDFWRMIWEHGLELIVMLTNLEEYSKVKCSKYWPDEVRGSRAFGAITVHHVSEKRYSDYIVRELKIVKQPTNSEGQPIVDNNGVAKRNGDCKDASESSAPTSPREAKDTSETRIVRQYHFLMWKDFAAPEHPHSILKFIKRVNEAWSNVVGPVVVHCSAGVGRTGTLVALDCLLEQLKATGQAAVFNTVCELRRQRNFLVQSLFSGGSLRHRFAYKRSMRTLLTSFCVLWFRHFGLRLSSLTTVGQKAGGSIQHCVRAEAAEELPRTVASELTNKKEMSLQHLKNPIPSIGNACAPVKQYVFVYRALVEYAHYGDTEIPASRLKASIDRLRNTPEGGDKCLMEHEFEGSLKPSINYIIRLSIPQCLKTKVNVDTDGTAGPQVQSRSARYGKIASEMRTDNRRRVLEWRPRLGKRSKMINSPVAEPVKSCAAGASEEVRAKNRSHDCLPYDRNRVILTPLPGRDFSTYINASFIEAYDNTEGFIITQDPLPNTIADFWRMVSEHNVSTIVMLSEIGEGKCPRYWDDGTTQHEHINVQYEESDSCPYYTRRQFRITNNKNGDTVSVRQLQYQGWPTAPGHVPEVTRGLAELADAARTHNAPPMLLRTERRVDVNSVARKVRSQRARTIDTFPEYEYQWNSGKRHSVNERSRVRPYSGSFRFRYPIPSSSPYSSVNIASGSRIQLQYEFLHRAILNYAELHNLLEDS